MNFIEEERQTILSENNTAQEDFLDILENLSPQTTEIICKQPLSGDLDFSILKECNFSNITTLGFQKGKITSLRNIPEGITKLLCPENLLINIDDLPISLLEIDLHENNIKRIDFSKLINLKIVNIANNSLVTLSDLPPSLIELKCENNQLKLIDLAGVENLKTFYCCNNKLVKIEHFPEDSITDFKMTNNPLLDIQRNTKSEEKDYEEKIPDDYKECLFTYFELKKEYMDKAHKLREQVYRKGTSKKAVKKMLELVKPQCINCKRPVGCIFLNEGRTYIARCGDNKNPCNFNIKIFASEYGNINKFIESFQYDINEKKDDIIKQKLDTLFNYIDEKTSVIIFKEHFEEYNEINMFLKELIKEYNDIYFNEEQAIKIEKKLGDIFRINERINELFMKYTSSDNQQILTDAMTIYINELKPEINSLRLIKNNIYEMDLDEKTEKYHLIQRNYTLDKMDFTFGSYPKVIKFTKN